MFDEGSEGHNLQVRLNCEQDFIPVVRLHPEVDVSNETAAAKSPQCRYVQPSRHLPPACFPRNDEYNYSLH
jgi:hypothetical protein